MPITNYAEYLSKVNNSVREVVSAKVSMGSPTAGRCASHWTYAALSGSSPSTPVVCTSATPGAMPEFVNSVLTQRLCRVQCSAGQVAEAFLIADRLSHQGGLDGTITGMVTTNLPTAALTRYTNGVGVWAAIEVHSDVGATTSTVRIRYTSDTGEVDVLSPLVPLGGTGFRGRGAFVIVPLLPGHSGVRSVSGVELTATTGSVGNYGVTLFRPLLFLASQVEGLEVSFDGVIGNCGHLPQVLNDACLFLLSYQRLGTTSSVKMLSLTLVEE